MYPDIDWEREPDIEALRKAYSRLEGDRAGAIAILKDLAERGSIASIWYLADAYLEENSKSGISQAQFWLARAEDAGWIQASYRLGRIAFQEKDYKAAFDAFSRGAATNYTPAIYRLAMMYKEGLSTKRDFIEAKRLLEVAAQRGHLFAKRDLAGIYLSGALGWQAAICGFLMLLKLLFELLGIALTFGWRSPNFPIRILA
ncbi:tetratricopeptide repeat protein [Methylocystis heyeri]|uniref:Sel1 repeat family protein n=1 Tax=Methylocystis heyeri TaxID=391905 RepID=A0A6B8KA50_9HYPH|nr:tetratricopeptide repeat protein [Methylocystis heyeri]QGM44966.1 hypothetical protein H2LOC_004275 [Methylocystis heyeri]